MCAAALYRQPAHAVHGCHALLHLQVKSGAVYEGVFHALRPSGGDFDVQLRMAKPVARTAAAASGAEWAPVRPMPVLAIQGSELVQLTAVDVRMAAADVGAPGSTWDDAGGFGTDAAISRARGTWGRERELQRWAPEEGDEPALSLEESVAGHARGWDQFAVNEAKFGVRTDYAEELYTTELDPRWVLRLEAVVGGASAGARCPAVCRRAVLRRPCCRHGVPVALHRRSARCFLAHPTFLTFQTGKAARIAGRNAAPLSCRAAALLELCNRLPTPLPPCLAASPRSAWPRQRALRQR